MAHFDWFIYRVLNRFGRRINGDCRQTWSQCGEDVIARYIFDTLRIPNPTYLDIGAHHPTYLSNTRLFYEEGGHGVNIEPDPELWEVFVEQRKRDVNLNVGVGERAGELKFHVMSVRTLNTFSEEDARAVEREGRVRIERVITLPVVPVNSLFEKYFPNGPDFLTLDVEGLDLSILRSIDFLRYRPKVVCVETISYSERRAGRKIPEIAQVMQEAGYLPYADTYINTLFVDSRIW